MKPKIKTGISAIMIIGWIFAGLGSVFLIMGILFLTQSGKEEAFKMLGLIFGGTGLFFYPAGMMKNNMVKIYTRPDNFKRYYMDIDEILPEVQMH